jgi:di/tricarboxylate transporter
MAVFWTTEAIPLSVTAMLPIIVFPMMGVSKVKDLASKYVTVSTIAFNRLSLKFESFPLDLNLSYLAFQSFDWLVGWFNGV